MTRRGSGSLWGVFVGNGQLASVAFPTKGEAEAEAEARNTRHATRVAVSGLRWTVRRCTPSEVWS